MYWFILVYLWFVAGMTTVALLPRALPLAGNLLVIAVFWPLVALGMMLVCVWDRLSACLLNGKVSH